MALRQFAGIDLGSIPVPGETTICKFRHLLEEHSLGEEILGGVNLHPEAKGVRITRGTIVDAIIIHAPSSTKNRSHRRDPEMHQGKKRQDVVLRDEGARGVDSKTKMIHTTVATAAMCPMWPSCPTCCTATRRGYGATAPIKGKGK